jgi:hypothetical protein
MQEGLLSFAPPDVKTIMEYFSRTLLTHLKLYQFAMVQPQEARDVTVVAKVETTIAPPPLGASAVSSAWGFAERVCMCVCVCGCVCVGVGGSG